MNAIIEFPKVKPTHVSRPDKMVTNSASTWNLPPPKGFQGLRDDLPLTVYEEELPHWRQDGATYFVTFRLGDSLPECVLRELREFRRNWLAKHRPPQPKTVSDAFAAEYFRKVEKWLDEGMGDCALRRPDVAQILVDIMRRGDGTQFELGCYVVMPNHVHAIVRPLQPTVLPLEGVCRLWKGPSSYLINQQVGKSGSMWQRESYDRIIRDPEHLYRVIQYIGRNPVKAKLPSGEYRLWIRPEWVAQGWTFESVVLPPTK